MKEKVKKKYEKPMVSKVRLEAKVSVLGACKNSLTVGPFVGNYCDAFGQCNTLGS